MASALSLMAPLGLPRLVAAQATPSSTPLTPVGTVPSTPAGSVATGQLPSDTPIQLSVVLRSSNPKGLEAAALAVSTPGSPQYRHYLTPAEVEQQFGPSPGATADVDAYLTGHGLALGPTLGDGLIVTASGTAGAVTGALHTGIMTYRQRSGRVLYANTSQPQMPSSVAPGVESVIGLDDTVQLQPQLSAGALAHSAATARTVGTLSPSQTISSGARPCGAASSTASAEGAYTANELASTYGFTSAYRAGELGKGVTVGLFELAGYSKDDLSRFDGCYNIKVEVEDKKVEGGARPDKQSIETELDIEVVASLAPKAKILVYEAPDSNTGIIDDYGTIEADDQAKVVSTSWGICERLASPLVSAENTIFQGMAAQGQSVVAAAGDTGSEDCYGVDGTTALEVDDPASQPWVTGVGGTDLTADGTPPTETVWNDDTGAGGGGISRLWAMPSWQFGPGVVNGYSTASVCGASSGYCREVPDVSASADPNNGYVEYCSVGMECRELGGGWFAIGGTSAAAPLWAALLAVADESLANAVGFVDPALYAIAANGPTSDAFNDITSGDNDYTGTNGGRYPATSGYDMASGLGTPNGDVLIPLLRG